MSPTHGTGRQNSRALSTPDAPSRGTRAEPGAVDASADGMVSSASLPVVGDLMMLRCARWNAAQPVAGALSCARTLVRGAQDAFPSRLVCRVAAVVSSQAVWRLIDVSTLFRTQNRMSFESLLIDQRSERAIRCMTALAIREDCNVCTHGCLGLFGCVILLQRDQGGFERMAEALGHGVVPPVAPAVPPGLSPVLDQALPVAPAPY